MTDNVISPPTGQALVNSHTFWGILLTAASSAGVVPTIAPFLVNILKATGAVSNPVEVINAVSTLASVAYAIWGRTQATTPITGTLKAK